MRVYQWLLVTREDGANSHRWPIEGLDGPLILAYWKKPVLNFQRILNPFSFAAIFDMVFLNLEYSHLVIHALSSWVPWAKGPESPDGLEGDAPERRSACAASKNL